MINGVSNNNNLNPGGLSGNSLYDAPTGEAQSIFLDTSLVESVTTYTENIGAEYGGFTGGVVDAKLKDAHTDRWHIMTNFRYTKDSWAKFHLTDAQKNINQSTDSNFQPEFNKYEYTVTLDGPINDNLGLLVSYGKQHSKIPLWSQYNMLKPDGNFSHKERRTQFRDNENYLIRLNTHDIDDLEASLTAIYAPYTSLSFASGVKDSDYDVVGGGLNIAYDMKNALNFGILKTTLAYRDYEQSIKDDNNLYYIFKTVPNGYVNWNNGGIYGYEGGYGDEKLNSKNFIYKNVLELDEFNTGNLEHAIKAGIEAEFGKVRYKSEETFSFIMFELNSSVTGNKNDGIIAGEQWSANKGSNKAMDNKKSYTTAALFLEDTIKYDRYTFRPGLRFSTDTVTNNKDIAPRLFANADIFDDKTLNVYGGYNRYYGGLILYNAIYESNYKTYARNSYDAPWVYDNWTVAFNYNIDGIKTPYSNEFSLGASLNHWDTKFKFDYVKREYRDQLKQKTVSDINTGNGWDTSYKNTNDGKSDYWGITLTASKEYEFKNTKHFSEFSITKSEASNNLNGINGFSREDDYSQTYITYDGKLKKYEDVPSPDYNAPLVITYSHIMDIDDYLKFGLNARYEKGVDGYKWVDDWGGLQDPDGKDTRVYESKHYKDSFTVDLTANYDLKLRGNKLTFGVEVLNLLNRKNDADYSSSNSFVENYAMGRQFYANFRYEY
jgi:hypothetical protein